MSVMMQAFYWDCPQAENKVHGWWRHVTDKIPSLKASGVCALWLPPVHKAANLSGPSMGYDPYDYFDLGEFNQKGSIPTLFGTRPELQVLIDTAHAQDMQVYADMVLNHNSGGDAQENNPFDSGLNQRWTKFNPASKRFPRDWQHFHPSRYETTDGMSFGDMPDLCHRHPHVYANLMDLAIWLVEEIGFDGFRYDFVKGYGTWLIKSIQEYRYTRGGREIRPYGIAENWSGEREISDWLADANAWSDNPVDAFDFPLRYALKDLCDSFGYDLTNLCGGNKLYCARPLSAVTFVDNHDFRGGDTPEIVSDKLLAYSFILTHEGYPCVYWKDYFNYGLAMSGTPNGIDALMGAHNAFAGGPTRHHHVDHSLYIMQRTGWEEKPGLVYLLNNDNHWRGHEVATGMGAKRWRTAAWWSARDDGRPYDQQSDSDGKGVFFAPPRGFAVYVPE